MSLGLYIVWSILAFVYSVLAILLCLIFLQPSKTSRAPYRPNNAKCSLGVFLGSGGHTSEMKTLLSTLDYERYQPRTYIYCHGDDLSLKAVSDIESSKGGLISSKAYYLLSLPRARRVGQPLLSTMFSALKTLYIATLKLFLIPLLKNPRRPFVDLLIVNGPGTCVVLVLVSYIRRILGLEYTRIIYVESFARVKSLSLSGKMIRPFVDRFLVQWPDASDGDNVIYKGLLV
ncbi:UDP-N-acetylglucosamine transferase subunit ALG14 [Cryptococcus neoformans c45]|nr:UDP-N-acetylglucosamine transferase subunit ALG14 [Cryptococcus neoformans var. grubii c45]